MNADWATWALQFLIVLGIGRVWLAIDNNTKELGDLRADIPQTYETKRDADRHEDVDAARFKEVHDRIDGTSNRVHGIDLRITSIDGGIKEAQAGLRETR